VSDFLSRLAERALGKAPVVEPLVRSRYEPVHELLSEEKAAPVVAAPAPPPPEAARPAAIQPRAGAPRPAPAPHRGRAAAAAAEADETGGVVERGLALPSPGGRAVKAEPPLARQTVVEPSLAPPPAAHRAPAAGAEPAPRRRRSAAPASGGQFQEVGETLATVVAPPTRRRAERQPADVPLVPLGADPVEAASALARAPEVEGLPADRGSPVPLADVVAVPADPRERPGSRRTERVPARAGDPVQPRAARRAQPVPQQPVRVTIGRVEVVAEPPAPAPAPAPMPAYRLSLDEYLRTRGGLER
jgi:hypothetical protein